jgi:hypothetical protein
VDQRLPLPKNNFYGAIDSHKEVKTIMMHDNNTMRLALAGLLIGGGLLLVGGAFTAAQAQEVQDQPATVKKGSLGTGRDPFRRYEAPRVTVKRRGETLIPSIQERINLYKAQKLAAMNARMPAPKPTTALLLSEIQVIGISHTPRGYAAIVEATPIKLSYVIYPGEPFFDGQLVAIEDNRLVFRHETVFSDGHRERAVEIKPLRQPTPSDSMINTSTSVAAVKP